MRHHILRVLELGAGMKEIVEIENVVVIGRSSAAWLPPYLRRV